MFLLTTSIIMTLQLNFSAKCILIKFMEVQLIPALLEDFDQPINRPTNQPTNRRTGCYTSNKIVFRQPPSPSAQSWRRRPMTRRGLRPRIRRRSTLNTFHHSLADPLTICMCVVSLNYQLPICNVLMFL